MRSLRITLRANKPITLPLAYNELVQGLIYSCWKERYPHVHDSENERIRKFVFGRLEGKCKVSVREKTIRFFDLVSFEVRTPCEELLDECASELSSRPTVRLGAHEFSLINLQTNDRLLFPPRAVINMLTPVVEYHTTDDGHTIPISPQDSDWLPLIQANTARKAEELCMPLDSPLQAIALGETMKKQVTRFKGTYVTGWTGKIMLAADPSITAMLWCSGLGTKNSQGFGMFDIDDTTRF